MGQLFQELKRRNVIRMAVAYMVAAWLLIEVSATTFPLLRLPEWTATFVTVLLMIGFPIALIFAWVFELTPEGIKLEKHVVREESITRVTGRKLDFVVIAMLVGALGFFAYDKFVLDPGRDAVEIEAAIQAVQPSTDASGETQETKKSIAVLPFEDLSESQDQQWFADGLAEEIINTLVRAPDLMVSSRISSFSYRYTDLSAPQIAKELGVAHILKGSVRRTGERIRVTARLTRAVDGIEVWSEHFDRDAIDVISIQEDVAINIAYALKTTMDPVALKQMLRAGTRSVEAYEHYLNGLASIARYWEESDSSQIKVALDHFESARNTDPGFAAAHYNSALIWKNRATNDVMKEVFLDGFINVTSRQAHSNFRSGIGAAIENAPDELQRMLYQAEVAITELRGTEAVHLLRRVLEKLPNSFDAAAALSEAARLSNDKEAQIQAAETFLRRGDMLSIEEYVNDVRNFVPSEHYVASVLEQVERFPNSGPVIYQAHRALLWAGEFAEAHKLYPRLVLKSDRLRRFADIRQACSLGDRLGAEEILRSIAETGDDPSGEWYFLTLLGEHEKATQALKPLVSQEFPMVLGIFLLYEQFDPRPFPTLMKILEREGLEWPPPREIPFACPPK